MTQDLALGRVGAALLALLLAACGGSSMPTAPSPVPTVASGFSCRIGSASCAEAMQGQTVTFVVQPGSGPGLRSARLDFGDGAEQDLGTLPASVSIPHEYAQTGAFMARLITVDVAGESETSTQAVRVGTLVTASVGVSNEGGLNVVATARVDGATVVLYEWLFEGPTVNVATTVPQARYTFSSPGFKDIAMRATLADGRVIRTSAAVVVE